MTQSIKYNIDESHGLPHSMNVLLYAKKIYDVEVIKFPQLVDQEHVVYASAILHDMCDKKYMNEIEGIQDYYVSLRNLTTRLRFATSFVKISNIFCEILWIL
jgi:HD superfamily phosphodiesterase